MAVSKKWASWIGTQGWFDPKTGKLHLTFAKILRIQMHMPYPIVMGEKPQFLIISFDGMSVSLFPKKYVILPKKV